MVKFACFLGLIFGIGAVICAIAKFAAYVGKNITPDTFSNFTTFDSSSNTHSVDSTKVNRDAIAGVAGVATVAGASAFALRDDFFDDCAIEMDQSTDLTYSHLAGNIHHESQKSLSADNMLMDPVYSNFPGNIYNTIVNEDAFVHEEAFGPDIVNDPAYSFSSANVFHDSSTDFSSSGIDDSSFSTDSMLDTSSAFDSVSFDSCSWIGSESMFDSGSSFGSDFG